MAYFLMFGVLVAGYTLMDWGHYYVQHRPASMWWLVSGKGQQFSNTATAPNVPPWAKPGSGGLIPRFGPPAKPAQTTTGMQTYVV